MPRLGAGRGNRGFGPGEQPMPNVITIKRSSDAGASRVVRSTP
jgi:hypothetical protein